MCQYIGDVVTVPVGENYGFVGLGSLMKADGTEHGLETSDDVFVHQDDCNPPLEVGLKLMFRVEEDHQRGEGTFRAKGAVEVTSVHLLPAVGAPIPGFAGSLATIEAGTFSTVSSLSVHTALKKVPEETVATVIKNQPMPDVPRVHGEIEEVQQQQVLMWLLEQMCPTVAQFGADYKVIGFTDEQLDAQVEETVQGYEELGLDGQVEPLRAEVDRFKDVRGTLSFLLSEGLVRPDCIIPIERLPDLFMAVPVWYYYLDPNRVVDMTTTWKEPDPKLPGEVQYFCDLFPLSQRWMDTFQLFNRRVRPLRMYKGESIPPQATERMRKAVECFDYVVIATPYHDEAGKDWEDLDWIRAIDPYILGFKKDVPYFFVLARFSDSGTFPLFNELVANTIEFLKTNMGKLVGFNEVAHPYWRNTGNQSWLAGLPSYRHGNYLMARIDQLLQAFEDGTFFDWLREQSTDQEVVADTAEA